ncbi:MAG: ABC transporter ATP-binding protein [Candidatus Cloacimonadota bacterium]|nr:ABC transporter ATP-binding protein [Candidatus Cloacimonadota bacterium]
MLITAKNITKTYSQGNSQQKLIVLNDLNFELKAGTIVSITGLSGSGKSTLLHILSTLDKSDSGSIYFKDEDIKSFSDNKIANFRNKHIGFVFQFHHLLPELDTLENVAIPMMIAGESVYKSKKEARAILKKLRMDNRSHHFTNQLSGGEQQRVAVARALVNHPEIIFADEPTGSLDKKHSDILLEILFDLNTNFSTSLLLVTHNEQIASRTDSSYRLEQGKLVKL